MRSLCMSIALLVALASGLVCAGPPAPSAPAIPFKRDAAPVPGGAGALGILALSAAAIGAVLLVRKRLNLNPRSKDGAPSLLRVLETQRLGPRALLSVVEFGGARYMIAQSEHGITCLASAAIVEPA